LDQTGNVDIINITYLDDEMDTFELWQDRTLDIAPLPITEREAFMERSPDRVRVVPDPVFFYIGFDFGSQVFREPEVRRAFSAAIDRQRLVDELYEGRAIVMRHVTIPTFVGSVPLNEVGVGYSPGYARQQMAASTFRSCALLPEVTFLVSSADLSLRQAELLRNMWIEELGCLKESIHIEQVQFGELLALTRKDSIDRPDLWELAWAPTFPDTQNILGSLIHCQDGENRQNRECSEPDNLLRQAATTVDPADRTQIYRQVESLLFNETGIFPIAPLYIRSREVVVQGWAQFTPSIFGGQQWDRITLDAGTKELERSR
jgi:ABC-type oligopeptide transport system substrate-binding subunit